ncbi:MAG TPA: sigma-70 family RNA polymerase sigma factor [Tepidisphaeraceae bacterium]|nr:sigma-70 family RNA polymerase sigma factor [Tepidisphaeraceae bacterium]
MKRASEKIFCANCVSHARQRTILRRGTDITDERSILDEYVQSRSESAFKQLVDRYINIVYSAAKRQTGDAHLAEDVTQAVFLLLARKAAAIPTDRPLSAWLLKTTAYCAANTRRARLRRLAIESGAAAMNQPSQDQDSDWESVAPILDEGLGRLRSKDRELLLWRYFEGHSIGQIAQTLQVSEDAANKRISRAIERLRDFFQRKGVTISAGVVATLLISKTSEAAPAGLSSSVSANSMGGTGTAISLTKEVIIMGAGTKLKVAAIAAVVLLFISGAVVAVKYNSQGQGDAGARAPTQTPKPAAAWLKGAIKFSDDTIVEVLGIQDDPPADPGRWWLPDGSETPAPQFPKSSPMSAGGFGTRNIRFIICMGPPIGDRNLRVVVTPRQSEALSVLLQGGMYWMNLLTAIPNNTESATIKIGLGIGPWTETILYDAATAKSSNRDKVPVRIGSISEEKGRTQVQVFEMPQPDPQRDEGIVLVASGKQLAAGQVSRSFMSGATYTFDCPKDQMTQILFRSRPYEFIEMKNVSLKLTAQPTEVQIVKIDSPTTLPYVKETTP